jgi:hypothetical protein
MATKREAVLAALTAQLDAALKPELHDLVVRRGGPMPEVISDDGLVVVRDGTPALDAAPLGQTGPWYWSHIVPVEVVVRAGDDALRDQRFDTIVGAIGDALDADTTLGGLIHGLDYGPPVEPEESPIDGAAGFKHGLIEVALDYETPSRVC